MELKCNSNPYYFSSFAQPSIQKRGTSFYGYAYANRLCDNADLFVKNRVTEKNTHGIHSFVSKIGQYAKNYVKNIEHTYEHKIVFAMIEKELFGKNSIDSLTHDADKLILYALGFPKSFVTKWHREHSVHHTESGKRANLRSMICDNIASSPEFKPEKKKSLREHYKASKELQSVQGFGELLEKFNYGENLDFARINAKKDIKYGNFAGMAIATIKTLVLLLKSGIEGFFAV